LGTVVESACCSCMLSPAEHTEGRRCTLSEARQFPRPPAGSRAAPRSERIDKPTGVPIKPYEIGKNANHTKALNILRAVICWICLRSSAESSSHAKKKGGKKKEAAGSSPFSIHNKQHGSVRGHARRTVKSGITNAENLCENLVLKIVIPN
jgi:hypothetical protein